MKNKRIIGLVLAALILFIYCISIYKVISLNNKMPVAENGNIYATNWSFTGDGPLKLRGDWNFTPTFKDPNEHQLEDAGTYTMTVHSFSVLKEWGIYVPEVPSTYRLYINGQLIKAVGDLAFKATESSENYQPYTSFFKINKPEIEIRFELLYFQNSHVSHTGFLNEVEIGNQDSIIKEMNDSLIATTFARTTIFLISLYFIFIFFFQSKERLNLYAGLTFFTLSCITGPVYRFRVIGKVFDHLSVSFNSIMNDILIMLSVLFVVLFIREYNTRLIPKWLMNFVMYVLTIYSTSLLIMNPVQLHDKLYNQYIISLIVLVIIGRFIWSLIVDREKYDWKDLVVFAAVLSFMFIYVGSTLTYFNQIIFNTGMILYSIIMLMYMSFRYVNQVKQLQEANAKLEKALKYEMAFLQTQIKPHFLYNALSNIIAFCYTNGERAAELLQMLTQYLRFMFDMGRDGQLIKLSQELEIIQAYVKIEEARYANRFDYELEIAEDVNTDKIRVPAFSLEPIVENAIRHGLFNKMSNGKIRVVVSREGFMLKCVIEDNGIGISEDTIAVLMKGQYNGRGIGFSNVIRRLEQIKGASMKVDSTFGEGTRIIILLPIQ
jgi:two-component system, LytTR family, sensor kinase